LQEFAEHVPPAAEPVANIDLRSQGLAHFGLESVPARVMVGCGYASCDHIPEKPVLCTKTNNKSKHLVLDTE